MSFLACAHLFFFFAHVLIILLFAFTKQFEVADKFLDGLLQNFTQRV